MNSLSIVFMGTPEFALPSLEALYESPFRIKAVVTSPDRPRGRGLKVQFSPVKKFALRAGIEVLQPNTLKDSEFRQKLEIFNPDLIVTVAYGKILPPVLLELPSLGGINLHASRLPFFRGAAPINRAIMEGATVTGVTVIRMTDRLDAGDMVMQALEPILIDDTAGSLHDRLALTGSHLLLQAVEALATGSAVFKTQDPLLVSYAPPLKPEEERINWNLNNLAIYNQIRGLSPFPGAYTVFKGKRLKVLTAAPPEPDDPGGLPGEILQVSGEEITVATAAGSLRLLKVQPEGRSLMAAGAFGRGYHVRPGTRFE